MLEAIGSWPAVILRRWTAVHHANDDSRERLQTLLGRLTEEDLARPLDDDWTVGMLLAHTAFWDRFVLERWHHAARQGLSTPIGLQDEVVDLVNAALMDEWRAVRPAQAAELALAAADAVDRFVAAVPEEQTAELLAAGRERLLDRSRHRAEHLEAIERALPS